MLKTPIGRLRLIGMIEGLSFLVLLFFAMPQKYIYGDPSWVKVTGQAWPALGPLLLRAGRCQELMQLDHQAGLGAFIASMLPFGPFVVDRKLKDNSL